MTKSGTIWTVTSGGTSRYSGTDTSAALTAAFSSLTAGRTTKQSVLVQGDGDIPATAQFAIPSYTILNWCGTLDVSGTPSGSARPPLYARGKTDIDIPNLKMTGSPQYGIFIRETNNVHLGQIDLRFCVANSVGKIGTTFPAGNIHVGKVIARGGGRGIFSVSGCGGLTIDQIDIANTGNTSILLQNTHNTTIAALSGTVVGGLVQVSNDTTNTNAGTYPPTQNVAIKNLTLSGGASVRQDWCTQYGANGCTASNVTGGTVSMCP
jgi:hypothetical protein